MKLISWNVNGIRAAVKHGFLDFVRKEQPDILCLQETKPPKEGMQLSELTEYEQFWSNAQKPGYSSTAIFTKIKPIHVSHGLEIAKHDNEGRVNTAEFQEFYLVNVYVPNSKRELERLPYRHKEWDVDFLEHIKKLEKKKPVIFCGDLNVAHKEIDLTYPAANVRSHGFTIEERTGMDNIVAAGYIDTFRHFNKEGKNYTWWSPMSNSRAKNIGWRIDYFLISEKLLPNLKKAFILNQVMGSDHCPVGIEIK